ncbi:MAG TPA: acetolactate decarboxylase [Prolixibacteraceae bacterium]|nr:acetolactate decarboxylase [Prolixibacteraceae bacterium]
MKHFFILFLVSVFLFVSCATESDFEEEQKSTTPGLIQISLIDALLQGFFDGYYPIGEFKKLGDIGIGTFDALDGEMIVLNDTVFQVLSTGEIAYPSDTVLTPFASIAPWSPDTLFQMEQISFDSMKANFDTYFPTPNIFYSVMIKGKFRSMKTRSVPRQEKPYPGLAEVAKHQPEFSFTNTSGVIVGFFSPAYSAGIGVDGFHLHYLTDDRRGGGHILAFDLTEGTMELGYLFRLQLIFPEGGDFFGGDFAVDRSEDLDSAEK